jgi:hypothetical protein
MRDERGRYVGEDGLDAAIIVAVMVWAISLILSGAGIILLLFFLRWF